MENIIGLIEQSPLWKALNEKARALYEDHGRTPTEEEYQALRNIIICKVMLEEPQIREVMAEKAYEHFQKEMS